MIKIHDCVYGDHECRQHEHCWPCEKLYFVPLPKDRRGDALNQRFSTCGSLPPWRSNGPFSGAAYQITYISDIYITINNGNKITVMKSL